MRGLVRLAARRAGSPGGLRFTRRQLYFELLRLVVPADRLPRRPRFTVPAPISYARFEAALGDPPGLLPEPDAAVKVPLDEPPDLYDYGLPRLLVCQDRSIAGMLLANGLHMESACPVFAVDDLPLDPRLVAMLHRAPESAVHVLHDASPDGVATIERVRAAFDGIRVNPLGLRPVHAAALHLSVVGNRAEVAAVNPARLLRTVHRLVREQTRVRPSHARIRQMPHIGYMSWPDGSVMT